MVLVSAYRRSFFFHQRQCVVVDLLGFLLNMNLRNSYLVEIFCWWFFYQNVHGKTQAWMHHHGLTDSLKNFRDTYKLSSDYYSIKERVVALGLRSQR